MTFIDAKQLADILGLTVRHVQRLAATGSLPHHRFGDLLRFDLQAVLAATGCAVTADDAAITRYTSAMRDKMAKGRVEGRTGWESTPVDELHDLLARAASEQDYASVGNYAMMLFERAGSADQ